MKVFKVEAQGDKIYFNAKDEFSARQKLFDLLGPIPEDVFTIKEVPKLPEGEEFC